MQKSSTNAERGLIMLEVLVATAVAGLLVTGLHKIVGNYASLAKRGAAVLDAPLIAHRAIEHLDELRGTGSIPGYSWRVARSPSPVAADEIRRGFRIVTEEIRVVGPSLTRPVTLRTERLVR